MRLPDRHPKREQVRRYWAALVGGAPPAELARLAAPIDPTILETIARVRAARHRPRPDPVFVARLEAALMNAFVAPVHSGNVPLRPNRLDPTNGRAMPSPWLPALPINRHRRRWVLTQLATVVLLIVTIVAMYLVFGSETGNRVAGPPAEGTPNSIPAPMVEHDVPMLGGNPARTGELPGPAPSGRPAVRWRFQLGDDAMQFDSASQAAVQFDSANQAVVDGVVYGVAGNIDAGQATLFANNAATGEARWQADVGTGVKGFYASAPAVAADLVYVAGGEQDGPAALRAFEVVNGRERWRIEIESWSHTSSPAVVDGVVYLTSGGPGSSPAVANGVVYVGGGFSRTGGTETTLHAVDAATGLPRWNLSLEGIGYFAVDAATGVQRWFAPTAKLDGNTPVVSDGVVYAGSDDSRVYAIDAATGTERWRFQTGNKARALPVVVDYLVNVASRDDTLFALDAGTGQEQWRTRTGAGYPTIVDGVIYAGDGDGYLYALADPPAGATPAP